MVMLHFRRPQVIGYDLKGFNAPCRKQVDEAMRWCPYLDAIFGVMSTLLLTPSCADFQCEPVAELSLKLTESLIP